VSSGCGNEYPRCAAKVPPDRLSADSLGGAPLAWDTLARYKEVIINGLDLLSEAYPADSGKHNI